MSTKKLDPQLGIAMDWNFNIIINEYMTCLTPMSFNLGSERGGSESNSYQGLAPTSIQLGSEPLFPNLYLIVT